MKRYLTIAILALSFGLSSTALAGGDESELQRFGPYEALSFDNAILNDVKFESDGNVFLRLLPEYKEKELVVKISDGYFASYRQWAHGSYDLVSPATQGKAPYSWTDRVNTGARYIEYWMDGEVFLHLKRVN